MLNLLIFACMILLLALAGAGAYWYLQGQAGGQSPLSAFFRAKPEKRLAIVEHANLDGRRRLILIRRDGVEHLIMTGGPVDVVVETGIGAPQLQPAMRVEEAAETVPPRERRARVFGQRDKPQEAAQ